MYVPDLNNELCEAEWGYAHSIWNKMRLFEVKKEFIDVVNKHIDKWLKKNTKVKQEIKIINCYEITDFNYNITEILDSHDRIINTSGEKRIDEVFEDYKKEGKIEEATS